jgi:hypothetical protein
MNSEGRITNLLEISKRIRDGFEVHDEDFVEMMKQVIPLDEPPNLSLEEATWFHMAVDWLHEYSVLLIEYKNHPKKLLYLGMPSLPGSSGPFIDNMLTRDDGEGPDFSAVFTFGVEPS